MSQWTADEYSQLYSPEATHQSNTNKRKMCSGDIPVCKKRRTLPIILNHSRKKQIDEIDQARVYMEIVSQKFQEECPEDYRKLESNISGGCEKVNVDETDIRV